jgi:drug/metabolite transporter (DMT)-like permease
MPTTHPRTVLLRGVGVILVASCLFGAMAVCVRFAGRSMPAMQIAFVRFLGSLIVLLFLAGHRGLRPQGRLRPLLLRGLLGAAAIVLYYTGIQGAGAGLATMLHCTYPVPATLLAGLLMGESLNRRTLAAVALNLVGVVIILGPGSDLGSATTLGALSALGASVLAGGAVATARHLRATENAALITIYFMAVGVVVTAPSLLQAWPDAGATTLLALAGVVLTSAAGQWLLHQGLGYASATAGSLAAATSVVTAVALEAAVLGERLPSHALGGAVFMLAAIGLAAHSGLRT